jgi:hypothetical protein
MQKCESNLDLIIPEEICISLTLHAHPVDCIRLER